MTSQRPEQANPEGHIATLDPVSIELLLGMYAPQVQAMQEDIAKGYFFFEDLLGQFFERFQKHPILEAETLVRFGLLHTPPEGASIPSNSVRISIPILRNWNAVLARAKALEDRGERLKPMPARRSATALALDFGEAPLPTLTLPKPDPDQISLNLIPSPNGPSSTPPTPPQAAKPPTPLGPAPVDPGHPSLTDDPSSLPKDVQDLAQDFEEQLSQAPRKGAGATPQTIDDVNRIIGKDRGAAGSSGKASKAGGRK